MGRKKVLTDDERKARKREYMRKWYKANPNYGRMKAAKWAKDNPERHRAKNAKWRKGNPERVRSYNLERMYGITHADYEAMLDAQDHRCAICGGIEPGGRGKHFHVDHCHDTEKVRGLLCTSCNIGIGYLKENPSILQSAIDYLTP